MSSGGHKVLEFDEKDVGEYKDFGFLTAVIIVIIIAVIVFVAMNVKKSQKLLNPQN
jgi:hypothetical protein